MIALTVNGKAYSLDIEPETPLLWVIRDEIGLTGTKFGCGISMCGACTVHVNGEAVRSCGMVVGDAAGKNVTTIEGLSPDSKHPVQQAWLAEDVPQCGYCQSGQIMAAVAFLKEAGVNAIRFVCLVAAPEGIQALHQVHPEIPVYCAAIDRQLNDRGYIEPGLGDAGDRLFGT